MGNYAYLETLEGNSPAAGDGWKTQLSGKYFVPLFWLFLFEEADFIERKDEEGESLYLCESDLDTAVRRLEARRPHIQQFLTNLAPYEAFWKEVCDTLPKGPIRLDATEIVIMAEGVEQELQLALQAFELDQPPTEAQRAALFSISSPIIDLYHPHRRVLVVFGVSLSPWFCSYARNGTPVQLHLNG